MGADEVPSLHCRHDTPRRPHIAVYMADDLGFHDWSLAGSSVVQTPHLDSLARQGIVLTHFRAPTWCAPSRASFLTGRNGWEVGVSAAFGWQLNSVALEIKGILYGCAIVGFLMLDPRGLVGLWIDIKRLWASRPMRY